MPSNRLEWWWVLGFQIASKWLLQLNSWGNWLSLNCRGNLRGQRNPNLLPTAYGGPAVFAIITIPICGFAALSLFSKASFPELLWISLIAQTSHGCNKIHELAGFSMNQLCPKHSRSTTNNATLQSFPRENMRYHVATKGVYHCFGVGTSFQTSKNLLIRTYPSLATIRFAPRTDASIMLPKGVKISLWLVCRLTDDHDEQTTAITYKASAGRPARHRAMASLSMQQRPISRLHVLNMK